MRAAAVIEMQQEKQQRWMELQEKRHVATTDHKMKLPRPTLQKLTADDNIASYLHMFEQVAVQQKWPKDAWATQLAGLLTGDALETAESSKYEVVKQQSYAVLKLSRRPIIKGSERMQRSRGNLSKDSWDN